MPVTRKRKIEVARLAGFGLVLGGLFALFLAVVSSQSAGAEKLAPPVNGLRCSHTIDTSIDGSTDWIGDAVEYGACETPSSVDDQGSTPTNETPTDVTPTSKHKCGCPATTEDTTESTEGTTESTEGTTESTEGTTESTEGTTESTEGSTPKTLKTTPPDDNENTDQGGSPSVVTAGSPTNAGAPVSEVEAVGGQLPLTGSSSRTLAGFGALMVATGLAMSLGRRRRFVR